MVLSFKLTKKIHEKRVVVVASKPEPLSLTTLVCANRIVGTVEREIGAYTKRANKFGNRPLGNSIGVLLGKQIFSI